MGPPHRGAAQSLSVSASAPMPRPRVRNKANAAASGYGATFISFFVSCFSIYGQNGKIQCPPVVVAMRKFVASSPICKAVRPQPLPNRLAACFALALAGNVPPGMLKKHFDTFSPEWIVAAHASVPVVAMLRKATKLPPYAILLTVLGSVLGQMVGGRIEGHLIDVASAAHELTPSEAILTRMEVVAPEILAPWALCAAAAMWKHVSNPWDEPP